MTSSSDDNRLHHFTYEFRGARWGIEIPAASEAEATARLAKIAAARYDGEIIAKVGFAAGPLTRLRKLVGL